MNQNENMNLDQQQQLMESDVIAVKYEEPFEDDIRESVMPVSSEIICTLNEVNKSETTIEDTKLIYTNALVQFRLEITARDHFNVIRA